MTHHRVIAFQSRHQFGRLAALERAKRMATTSAISKKKGELAEQLISKAFKERFLKELGRLNGQRIRVKLERTRVSYGRALHQIQLDTKSKVSIPEVLSEGERRMISLAAFLADAGGRPTATPFVFDDPDLDLTLADGTSGSHV